MLVDKLTLEDYCKSQIGKLSETGQTRYLSLRNASRKVWARKEMISLLGDRSNERLPM